MPAARSSTQKITGHLRALQEFGGEIDRRRAVQPYAGRLYLALGRMVAEWDDETTGNSPSCPHCGMPVMRADEGRLCAYHEAAALLRRIRGDMT